MLGLDTSQWRSCRIVIQSNIKLVEGSSVQQKKTCYWRVESLMNFFILIQRWPSVLIVLFSINCMQVNLRWQLKAHSAGSNKLFSLDPGNHKRPFPLQKLLPPHWFSGLASIYYCETSSKKVYETAQLRLPSELLLITQIMHCCIRFSDARAWGCNPTKFLVVLQRWLTELFTWLIKVHHTHNHMNL